MVAAAGGILVLLGLLPKLGAVVAAVPAPVLGGAGLVMFGTVAASGLRTLAKVDFHGNHNLTVVAVSVAVGMLPVGVPEIYKEFPDWFQTVMDSGISAGCITALALNLLFNHLPGGKRELGTGEAEPAKTEPEITEPGPAKTGAASDSGAEPLVLPGGRAEHAVEQAGEERG